MAPQVASFVRVATAIMTANLSRDNCLLLLKVNQEEDCSLQFSPLTRPIGSPQDGLESCCPELAVPAFRAVIELLCCAPASDIQCGPRTDLLPAASRGLLRALLQCMSQHGGIDLELRKVGGPGSGLLPLLAGHGDGHRPALLLLLVPWLACALAQPGISQLLVMERWVARDPEDRRPLAEQWLSEGLVDLRRLGYRTLVELNGLCPSLDGSCLDRCIARSILSMHLCPVGLLGTDEEQLQQQPLSPTSRARAASSRYPPSAPTGSPAQLTTPPNGPDDSPTAVSQVHLQL